MRMDAYLLAFRRVEIVEIVTSKGLNSVDGSETGEMLLRKLTIF